MKEKIEKELAKIQFHMKHKGLLGHSALTTPASLELNLEFLAKLLKWVLAFLNFFNRAFKNKKGEYRKPGPWKWASIILAIFPLGLEMVRAKKLSMSLNTINMDYTNSKLYQLAIVILGTIGTILVGLNVIDTEQESMLKGLVPAIVGVVFQVIAFLQSVGVVKAKEAKVVEMKHALELKTQELEVEQLKTKTAQLEVAQLRATG